MATFPFWSQEIDAVAQKLKSSVDGLSEKDAQEILQRIGPNRIQAKKRATPLDLFASQFKSPVVLILIFATVV